MSKTTLSIKPLPLRRLATVKEACAYGRFSHTKCYSLINAGTIRAFKRDRQTFIDLDSIDSMHANLVPYEPKDRPRSSVICTSTVKKDAPMLNAGIGPAKPA